MRGVLAKIHFLRLLLDDWVQEGVFFAILLPEDGIDLQGSLSGMVLEVRLRLAAMAAEAVLDPVTHRHVSGVLLLARGGKLFHIAGGVSARELLLSAAQIHAICHSPSCKGRLSPSKLLHAVALNDRLLHFSFHELARKIGVLFHFVERAVPFGQFWLGALPF